MAPGAGMIQLRLVTPSCLPTNGAAPGGREPVMSLFLMGISLTRLVFAIQTPLSMWTWSDWLVGFINVVVLLAAAPLAYRRYRLVVDAERCNRSVVALEESGIWAERIGADIAHLPK